MSIFTDALGESLCSAESCSLVSSWRYEPSARAYNARTHLLLVAWPFSILCLQIYEIASGCGGLLRFAERWDARGEYKSKVPSVHTWTLDWRCRVNIIYFIWEKKRVKLTLQYTMRGVQCHYHSQNLNRGRVSVKYIIMRAERMWKWLYVYYFTFLCNKPLVDIIECTVGGARVKKPQRPDAVHFAFWDFSNKKKPRF